MGTEIFEAPFSISTFFLVITTLITYFLYLALIRSNSVIYLIDFACYLPADNLRVTIASFVEHLHIGGTFSTDCSEFQERVVERSGIGDEACMPIALHELPPEAYFKASLEEVEQVLFPIVEDLLSKHNISPTSIDILISNCSLFCPTPSITAMITNKFGFRSNIKSFSLSGMGCGAGLLSISLAKDLLKVSQEFIGSSSEHGSHFYECLSR
ncbi:3-KETOACYL-COA SYNTHASE [Salix purpurea]|uniref:3-KETOACYL-COA SYNTHASE n=1 Tax=Salix purpurea TaxID=77065 RepID=A0A9Q0YV76_SALPP|nr:3-KETOACYL-COA SYNTHASE [Salix purpurea]